MATDHNFRIKNGLTVGAVEVIDSSGKLTATAFGTNADEKIEDVAAAMITGATHSNITVTYNDTNGTLAFSAAAQYGDSDVESYLDGGTSTPSFASITSGAISLSGGVNFNGYNANGVNQINGTSSSGWLDFNMDTDSVYPQSTSDNQTVLGSVTHMNFVGDSNGNGTGGRFYWGYGTDGADNGTFTKTMDLDRSGNLTTIGAIDATKISVDSGASLGLRVHTNSGITASNNYMNFFTGQTSGWSFNANGTGADSDSVFTISPTGTVSIPHTLNHVGDTDTYVKFDDNRVRIVNGGTTYLDTNNGSAVLTNSTSFGGDVSGTYNAIVIADDSHNHVISNVDGLQSALDTKIQQGSNATAISNFSNTSPAGGFRVLRVTGGSDRFSTSHHNLIQLPNSSGNNYQIQIAALTESPQIGWRGKGTSWSDWYEIYHEGHKPTYAELGTMAYSNLTGTPTIPSLSGYATESYVGTQISNLVDSAPGSLDTLNELAAALGDDANFSTTVTNSIATKVPLAGGTMTGTLNMNSNSIQNARLTGAQTYLPGHAYSLTHDGTNVYWHIGSASGSTNKVLNLRIYNSSNSYVLNQWSTTGLSVAGTLTASGTVTASGGNSGNWNTAYGWGNHASAGYLTSFDITTQTDSKYLRSNADDTWSGNISTTSTNGIRFGSSNQTDTNDGYIAAGRFSTGLNIVGTQTSSGTGRQVRIWGDVITDGGDKFWNAGNDGAGSGLNADLLDDQHGSYYLNYNNLTNKPTIPTNNNQLTNGAGYITDGNTNWNNTYGFITNTSGTSKGANQSYVASSSSTSNRGNYGAGVWAYSGYSTGSNRPFTYDATLQVMANSAMGFEFSVDWLSQSSTPLKVRSLRDCCQGWSDYSTVWTSTTDGANSGLDADLLDGQEGSYYLNYNNLTNTPSAGANYYLDGISKSGNTLTFSVNGATNQTYTFGSNAFNSTTIPTNNNQLTNGAGYLTQTSAFNNQGQAHSTRTSFATGSPSFPFGFNFVQGNGNSPGVNSASQYYSLYTGLGSQYPATGSGSYGMELAIPRNVSSPYIAIRYNENNGLGSWQKISAGYADNADLLDGQHGSHYLNAGNLTGTLNKDRLPDFVHLGNATAAGYATDDGSWGARLNVASTVHAKIEVSQEANSMRSHWYAHTGHDSIKFGTSTSHDVEIQRGGTTRIEATAGGAYVTGTLQATGDIIGGTSSSNTDGQSNRPFRLDVDRSSYMVAAAGTTWGLFWAGNSGARYGTNGNGGPGNIWGNSGNPNEFCFVGSDSTAWTVYGNNGNTWQAGQIVCDSIYPDKYGSAQGMVAPRYDNSFYVLQSQHWYGQTNSQAMYLGESGNSIKTRGNFYIDNGAIYWDSTSAASLGGFVDRHTAGLNTDVYPSPIYSIGTSYRPSGTGLSNHYGCGYAHTNASFYSLSGQSGWGFYVSADGDARVQLGGGNGAISCTGNVTAYASDRRLKTNIKPLENALDKLSKIRGVEYDWIDNITTEYDFTPTAMHEVGVIAQEVQEVLPEVVREAPFNSLYTQKTGWTKVQKQMEADLGREVKKAEAKTEYEKLPLEKRNAMEDNHEFLTVDYDRIVPLLIEAIKEQQGQIEELKSIINTLVESK